MNPHTPTVNDSSYNYKVPVKDFLFREAVESPSHYKAPNDPLNLYETIKVIEAWQVDFNLGNALKYISRAGRKPGEQKVKDLEKAAYYVNRALENAKNETAKEGIKDLVDMFKPKSVAKAVEDIKVAYGVIPPEPVKVILDGLTVTSVLPEFKWKAQEKCYCIAESVGITSTTIKNG